MHAFIIREQGGGEVRAVQCGAVEISIVQYSAIRCIAGAHTHTHTQPAAFMHARPTCRERVQL